MCDDLWVDSYSTCISLAAPMKFIPCSLHITSGKPLHPIKHCNVTIKAAVVSSDMHVHVYCFQMYGSSGEANEHGNICLVYNWLMHANPDITNRSPA